MQTAQNQSPLTNVIRVVAVKNGEMAGTWEFKKDTITVGRAPTADVRLDSKDISRLHCTLQIRPAGIVVIDGGSLNGTRLNGERVNEHVITPRDLVQVGGFRFKAFLIARADEDAAEKTPAEDGPRVKLGVVPSAPSAFDASAATAPAIVVGTPVRRKSLDPLPATAEIIDPPEQETPDPLPPSAELQDPPELELEEYEEREPADLEKTPAQLPSFATPPAEQLADRVSATTTIMQDPAPIAAKPVKQKMARGTMLAIAFFIGSAIFFAASLAGGAAIFFLMVG